MRRQTLLLAANVLAVVLLTVCMGGSAFASSHHSSHINGPISWVNQDIGAVGAPGSTTAAGTSFTIAGSGTDIWYAADQFQYAYEPLVGDGVLFAQVTSQSVGSSPWAKAGIMIRQSVAANSANAYIAVSPGYGITFQSRPTAGALSVNTPGPAVTAPYWLELVRQGNNFTAFASADGQAWVQVGSTTTIVMGSSVLIGLAVTSHNNAALSTATFANVGITEPLGPTGPIGPQGIPGITGAVGAQGAQGVPGLQGPTGLQGIPGALGATGPMGAVGATGPTGAIGLPGPAGVSGVPGPVFPNLALGKPVTVTTTLSGSNNNVTDGLYTTGWSSTPADAAPAASVQLSTTAGTAPIVHGVELYWGDSSSRTFEIDTCTDNLTAVPVQVCNNPTGAQVQALWTLVPGSTHTADTNLGDLVGFGATITTQYVRVLGTNSALTTPYVLNEFLAY